MANQSKRSPVVPPEVRELIGESQKIQGWVERLADHADEARPEVYQRVLSDYRDRLEKVGGRLVKHRADLESNLEGHEGEVASLQGERDTHAAELEEARLRHVVGEYADAHWEERREKIEASISGLDERLAVEQEAVDELTEIIASIAEGGTPAVEEMVAEARAASPKVQSAAPSKPVVAGGSAAERPAAMKPAAAPPRSSKTATPAWMKKADELAATREPGGEGPADAPTEEPAGTATEAADTGTDEASESEAAPHDKQAPSAVAAEETAPAPEDVAGDYLDELEFLESLSLEEAERFDAVSAMLDEDESGNGKKEG